jgi:stage V sporulation protein R
MLEFNHMHSNVLLQRDFDDPHFSGLNPYALGFAMMSDIRRISTEPTDEDREWFPGIAGKGDWRDVLKDAWTNYRDESFIQQFLSPKLIRDFRMFALSDKEGEDHYTVEAIHDERGYRRVREVLAQSHDIGLIEPDIQVVDMDFLGERRLELHHKMRNGIPLAQKSRDAVMDHLRYLWGYGVTLCGVNSENGEKVYEVSAK